MQKKLPSINSAHGSETRNIINEIIKAINDRGLEILSESGFLTWLEKNGIKHREEVATFADLPSSDALNTVRGVESDNKIYIKKENGWVPFQTIDINKISLVDEKVEDISFSVKSFGAVGDGETDDSDAFQHAVDEVYSRGGGTLFIPKGVYLINKPIHFKGTPLTHAEHSHGIKVEGAGWETVLTSGSRGQATYSNQNILNTEYILGVHGSNYIFRDFRIINSRVGIYIGQDPRDLDVRVSSNYNTFDNIWTEYVGTSFLMQPGQAVYYNRFSNIHTRFGQIAIHLAESYFKEQNLVNNRNLFTGVTMHHTWCGLLLENGDTNTFNSCNFEQIQMSTVSNFVGQKPHQIHDGIPTAIYINNEHTGYGIEKNTFNGCIIESTDRHLYYDGYGNNFINNFFDGRRIEKKEGSGDVGTFIGTYSSEWAGLNIPGFTVASSEKNPLIDIKDGYGVALGDRLGNTIHDDGFRLKKIPLNTVMEGIQEFFGSTGNNVMYNWSLSGERRIILRTSFKVPDTFNSDDNMRINIPFDVNAYFSAASNEAKYRFPVVVSGNYDYQIAVAKIEYDGTHYIDVPPPQNGWNINSISNYISLDLAWMRD